MQTLSVHQLVQETQLRFSDNNVAFDIRTAADNRRDLEAFCSIVERVYQGDPHYAKPSEAAVNRTLEQSEYRGRQQVFVAERDGAMVARLVVRLPKLTNQQFSWGTIGQFESIDDPDVAMSLLREAVHWLRAREVDEVIGPMDGDTWHRYRFAKGPYDKPPFLMEPYNPPYYPRLWKMAGFETLESYHSKFLDDVTPIAEQFAAIHTRVVDRGYRLHAFDVLRFEQELDRLYELSLTIFAENTLYTPISRDDFREMYQPIRHLIDPQLVWFATSPEDEDVGFIFAIHDYQAALVAMRGQSGFLSRLRFWLNKRRASAINLKSMGVVPGHRRSGIGVALVCQIYRRMLEMGYRRANLCLIHDGNPSSRLDGGQGRLLRRYGLYRYAGET